MEGKEGGRKVLREGERVRERAAVEGKECREEG